MTNVWLYEPRSHGRWEEEGGHPRAQRGPVAGATARSHLPHRPASPALCPCGHAASFCRRASSFVRGAWSSAAPRLAAVLGWPARVQAPRAGGTGARVQGRSRRPQPGAAWAVVARCVRGTSSMSASAACGVRGVRAAQQRGSRQSYQSKRNASSIMVS